LDEVTGEWRKLPNEELNDLYSLFEKDEMGEAFSTCEGEETCVQGFGGKT
jgi:hypothetical protein